MKIAALFFTLGLGLSAAKSYDIVLKEGKEPALFEQALKDVEAAGGTIVRRFEIAPIAQITLPETAIQAFETKGREYLDVEEVAQVYILGPK
jgi:hypothetical protein